MVTGDGGGGGWAVAVAVVEAWRGCDGDNNTIDDHIDIRAFSVASLYFCTIWTVNSDIYLLSTYFFKYIFQQILYHFLYLI